MGRFLLALVVLFVLELIVIIKVGSHIGAFATLTVLFCFMVLGAVLVKLRFRQALLELQNNQIPSMHILWLPLSGFFFIFPGFISDIFAVMLLLPPVQKFLAAFIKKYFRITGMSATRGGFSYEAHTKTHGGRTIDATYVEVPEEENNPQIEHKKDQ